MCHCANHSILSIVPWRLNDDHMRIGGYIHISDRLTESMISWLVTGSLTLFHWHRLSTPGLGNILESREGIQVKGDEPGRHFEQQDHTLSDCEEDDDFTVLEHNRQKSTPDQPTVVLSNSATTSNSNDKECGKSSTRKSPRKSERSRHADERELFILLGATRVPLSTLVEDPTQKRTGCVIA